MKENPKPHSIKKNSKPRSIKKSPKPRTLLNKRAIEPYIWLLPSIIMMGVLILVPIITVFQTSFSKISKSGINKGFAKLDNYLWIFKQPAFRRTLMNTIVWTVVVVGVSTILGIILGLVLGGILEKNFRRSLVLSAGDWTTFFTRPISCTFIIIAFLSLFSPLIFSALKKRKTQKAERSDTHE